ncbi:MAG: zinc ribbon domain-containing protein, partial [Clostridia bacterium]|nr:zinc ribbon domain-containing protein [Clostridia bacterium]
MYCPECGTLNKDGSQFCLNCGHSLEGESGAPAAQPEPAAQFTPAPSAAPQYNAAPQYSAPAQNAAPQYYPGQNFAPYPAAGDTPAVKALRARASSPLFMIAAILVTLSVIAALVVALVPGKTDFILDIIGEVKSKTCADIYLGKVEDALDTAETASAASMITS